MSKRRWLRVRTPTLDLDCRALLFDMDGVLVDSLPTVRRHLRCWAARHSLDPEQVIDVSHGRTNHDLVQLVAPWLDAARESSIMLKLEASDISTIRAQTGAIHLTRGLLPASWAIVTSAEPSVAEARLAAARIPRPRVLVTAADVQYAKPHAECYLTAARRLRVHPRDCIVFEDAPSGITAGRAAGCRTIGVAGTVDPSRLHADFHLQSLGELQVEVHSGSE